jgi:AAA ATPase domain
LIFKFVRYRTTFDNKGLVSEELSLSNQDGLFISVISNETGEDGRGFCRFIDLENYFASVKSRRLNEPEEKYTDTNAAIFSKAYGILSRGQGTVAFKIGDQINEFFNGIKIMSESRKATNQLPSKEDHVLAVDGNNLVTVLNTIINHKEYYFPKLTQWFQRIVDIDSRVNAPPTGSYVTARLYEPGLSSPTNLENMSMGIEQIWILLLMFEGLKDSLCIEEPEVHVHSSAQKELYRYFQEKSSENQLLITTHSSLFTSLGNDTNLYLINKQTGVSECQSINKENELVLVRRSLGINNSDIYGADSIIFLEGPNDVSSFETVAKVLGFDQIGKNIFVESLGGTDNSPNLTFLSRYFKKSQCSFFAILDHPAKNVAIKQRLVADKLLEPDDIIIRSKQFEDLFDTDMIIECMCELANEYSFEFKLTSDELNRERLNSNNDVIGILRKVLKIDIDDYKTYLAKKLTNHTIQNIVEVNDGTRDKNEFENEIIKIMERVSKKSTQT